MNWEMYLTTLLVLSNMTWYLVFKVVKNVAESRKDIINTLLEEKKRA